MSILYGLRFARRYACITGPETDPFLTALRLWMAPKPAHPGECRQPRGRAGGKPPHVLDQPSDFLQETDALINHAETSHVRGGKV